VYRSPYIQHLLPHPIPADIPRIKSTITGHSLPTTLIPLLRHHRILHPIARHREKLENHKHPTEKDPRPNLRQPLRLIVDIHHIIQHPGRHIHATQGIQPPVIHTSHIARHHRCRKETDILEAVLLGGFSTHDAVFSCLCEGLVGCEFFFEGARVTGVEFLGGGIVVKGCRVGAGKEAEDPGCGNGVEGEVPGGVEEGGHGSGGVSEVVWSWVGCVSWWE